MHPPPPPPSFEKRSLKGEIAKKFPSLMLTNYLAQNANTIYHT